MNNTFFQKILLTVVLAAIAAGLIEVARHTANSVTESMNADLPSSSTPKPTPRRY